MHEGTNGAVAHAELRYGDGMIMLGSAGATVLESKTPRELGAVSQGVYVIVDGHRRPLRAAPERRVPRSCASPTTRTTARATTWPRDPEGNLWSFGTYRPD